MVKTAGDNPADFRDFKLRSADNYFNSTDSLLLFYECYEKASGDRKYALLKYNYNDRDTKFRIIGADANVLNIQYNSAVSFSMSSGTVYKNTIALLGQNIVYFDVTTESSLTLVYYKKSIYAPATPTRYLGIGGAGTKTDFKGGLPSSVISMPGYHTQASSKFDAASDSFEMRDYTITDNSLVTNCFSEYINSGDVYFGGTDILRWNPVKKDIPQYRAF